MKCLISALASVLILFSGCTITVTPLDKVPKKKGKRTPVHHSTSRSVIKKEAPSHAPKSANIKETWWVENYHKLEAAHGDYTIPDDANIEPLPDGRLKVPDAVLSHYNDLLLAKPSPDRTP